MKNIPENIYIQIGFEPDDTDDFNELSGVTWEVKRVYDTDLEFKYVSKNVSESFMEKAVPFILCVAVIAFMIWIAFIFNTH